FALGRVGGLTVSELARHRVGVERALAPSEFAGLLGGDPRPGSGGGLLDNRLSLGGVPLKPVGKPVATDLLHAGLGFSVAKLGLGLSLELRVGDLDTDDGRQALPDIVAGEVVVLLLEEFLLLGVSVDDAGEGGPKSLVVGAAFVGVDGVGEGVDR